MKRLLCLCSRISVIIIPHTAMSPYHIIKFSLASRPSGVTLIHPDGLGMRLTRIIPNTKFAISHVYCCISSFSRCHVTLIWPELSSTVIPKRFQVFVFKWRWLASTEQTWLYNSNTDGLYRFWRLTRLFTQENWTAWTMDAQFAKTISKGNRECWAFPH